MSEIIQPTTPSQFTELLSTIEFVDGRLASHASRAVNISLTVRNWLIGFYIVEFEQHGEDRAEYGDKLFSRLSAALTKRGVKGAHARNLRRFRSFYNSYPEIWTALSPEFRKLLPDKDLEKNTKKWTALSPESDANIRESVTPVSVNDLISRLAFSHITELIALDSTKNATSTRPSASPAAGPSASFVARSPACSTNAVNYRATRQSSTSSQPPRRKPNRTRLSFATHTSLNSSA